MSCEYEDRSPWLIDFLDGALEEAARRRIEAHLASCRECRRAVEEHRAVWRLLEAYRPPEPSAGFSDAVRAARARAGRVARLRRIAAAAAIVAALAGGARWLWWPSSSPTAAPAGPAAAAEPVDSGLLKNLDLLENLDFLEQYGEDLELAMDADLYDVLAAEDNL